MGTEQVSIHINLRSMSNCVKTEHYSLSLHKFRYGKGSLIKYPPIVISEVNPFFQVIVSSRNRHRHGIL